MKFHGLDQFQEWLVNNDFTISENTGRSDYSQTMEDGKVNEMNPTISQIWEAACQYAMNSYGINGHVMDR